MIIFTSNPYIINFIIGNNVIFNLSSLYSGYIDATALITKASISNMTPAPMNQFVNEPQFDQAYIAAIFGNPEMWTQFIRIMSCAYEGNNVFVLVEHDDYRDAITEALIKLIQVRYGYNCWIADTVEDLECVKETYFTPEGLMMLDNDIHSYDQLSVQGKVMPITDMKSVE